MEWITYTQYFGIGIDISLNCLNSVDMAKNCKTIKPAISELAIIKTILVEILERVKFRVSWNYVAYILNYGVTDC